MKIWLFISLSILKILITPALATQKISDDFYVAKIPGHPLNLAMERVTPENINLWKQYISVQNNPRVASVGSSLIKGRTNKDVCLSDGSGHFMAVLAGISFEKDETWVAYITQAKIPQKIPDVVAGYNPESLDHRSVPSFCEDLEMYVTVTSSEKALITSHLGIARTVESVYLRKTDRRNISLDLHSFAAKVMLERNPQRGYMVNAPVFAMEKIIIDALPDSVHVGTRQMQTIMQERKDTVFDPAFRQKIRPLVQLALKEDFDYAKGASKRKLNILLNKTIDGKKLSHQEIIKEFQRLNQDNDEIIVPEEVDGELKIILPAKKSSAILDAIHTRLFREYKNPYFFTPEQDLDQHTASFLKFMEKHPPMIGGGDGKWIKNMLIIADPAAPSKAWLAVKRGDKDYDWIFRSHFGPQGLTHYIMVDLKALANCKQVETTEYRQ